MLLPFLLPRGLKSQHAAIDAYLYHARDPPLHHNCNQSKQQSALASARTGRILALSIVYSVNARNTSIQPPDGLSTTG